ncbi:UDP-glycosyltransferase 76B1 [Bienertia sinuspersici]
MEEEVKQQSEVCHRLLLFPAPFHGHINPMLHLATLLHSKGFSITIIHTPYNPVNPIHYPHFTFHSLENDLLESYSKSPSSNTISVILDMNAMCSEPFKDCLYQILRDDLQPVNALIADPIWGFAGSVAANFNLPMIVLRTGSISALLVYFFLPSLKEMGYFPPQDTKSDEPLSEFPPLKVKDLPSESQQDILKSLVQETKNSKGIICNTFEELEESAIARLRQTIPIPIFPIGPLHKHTPISTGIHASDHTSITWLNTQAPNSVLYASFGSVATMSKPEFLELAGGLLESAVPFLLVARPGLIQGSGPNDQLPEEYFDVVSERGLIVKWAPQLEVLSHPSVGGFWTHNGWNSTLESISEGVPMICQPIFADQDMNARYVTESWKIGFKIEKGVKRDEIARAIRKLMMEEEGAEMRSRVTALKEKASLCLKEGGSSSKSLQMLTSYLLSF